MINKNETLILYGESDNGYAVIENKVNSNHTPAVSKKPSSVMTKAENHTSLQDHVPFFPTVSFSVRGIKI